YPCLGAKPGAPYGLYVHGDNNTTGAVRAVQSIATGMGWAEVVKPVTAVGPVGKDAERQCYELGATVAANLALRTGSPRCPRNSGATASPRGPHVTPLWYVWDGTALWLTSLTRSQRWTDIERDPLIAVLVDAG